MGLKYFETATAYSAANPKDSDICFVEDNGTIYTHGEKFGNSCNIFRGTCSTAAETTTKLVTCPQFTASDLIKGAVILITFDNTNTGAVASLKMDVNGTGAKPIKKFYTSATPSNLTVAGELGANQTKMFEYDGTNWVCMNTDYNSGQDNYYDTDYYPYDMQFLDYCGTNRICFTSATGTGWVPGTTSTATDATTARAVNTRAIDPFGKIIFYSGTASNANNTSVTYHYYTRYYTTTTTFIARTFNVNGGTYPDLTKNKRIYIKCTPQADGSAIIDATTPIVQDLPNTEDGKIYIHFGSVGTAAANYIIMDEDHPVYYYSAGAIRLWTNKEQSMIETTHADLKDLRDNGNLIPGQQYRITDYEFTTSASKTTSAGYNFDIIVTADDENTLNENARAVAHPGVAYFNDIALQAWQLKYCIDNDTDRFTWAQRDTGYCIMINNSSGWFEYTGVTNVVDGVTYYMFGTFYGCTSATPSINDEWKMFMGTSVMTSGSVYNVKEPTAGGKGVIYYMKDEYDNECPYDFKNLQYNIKKGFQVVISNSSSGPYTYTYEATGNSSVVSSTTYYEYTCAQQDMMGPSLPSTLYVKVSTLDSSMNLYSSINPVTEFTGYVAAMQWDVSINNIINSTQTIWTFDGSYSDATRLGYVSGVKMGSYITSYTGRYQLPWNYIRINAGDTAYGIIFEDGCTNIHLGSQSQYNITFKHGCNNISTDYACRDIICEEGCSYITIGARCYNLHFGVNCSRITVSTDGHDNSFGASCSSITLGKENFRCSFGNGCYSIKTGQYSYDYYFGNGCSNIKFGTSSNIKNYYSNIVIEPGNRYIYLSCTGTTSDTSPYKNVTIAQGVNNTTTWKTITDANVNQTYRTVYQPANSLTITV